MTQTPDVSIDEDALLSDLMDLLRIPSVSGSPAELEVQEHLAATLARRGLRVDRWDIDVEGLERDPQFPGHGGRARARPSASRRRSRATAPAPR